jgi:hypothetical protein
VLCGRLFYWDAGHESGGFFERLIEVPDRERGILDYDELADKSQERD